MDEIFKERQERIQRLEVIPKIDGRVMKWKKE
jgi:hypothetical protein